MTERREKYFTPLFVFFDKTIHLTKNKDVENTNLNLDNGLIARIFEPHEKHGPRLAQSGKIQGDQCRFARTCG
jgi:pyruvate/2-oxoacid:ferredoxin oxidoreductase alpha subunit